MSYNLFIINYYELLLMNIIIEKSYHIINDY